jgi:hypothetical protein
MSIITYNPNDNQIPLQQQQQPIPPQALQGAGVYWGNQPNHWGNQITSQPNYWHNQPPNYWHNQPPNYWHNQPPNYWHIQPPNYWNTQFNRQSRSRFPCYNFCRRYNNNNYRPQQRQHYANMNNNYNSGRCNNRSNYRCNNNGSNQPLSPPRNRTYGPKRPKFGDLLSPSLQNRSTLPNIPNCPLDLDLSTTETTPVNVLPQLPKFTTSSYDNTVSLFDETIDSRYDSNQLQQQQINSQNQQTTTSHIAIQNISLCDTTADDSDKETIDKKVTDIFCIFIYLTILF